MKILREISCTYETRTGCHKKGNQRKRVEPPLGGKKCWKIGNQSKKCKYIENVGEKNKEVRKVIKLSN